MSRTAYFLAAFALWVAGPSSALNAQTELWIAAYNGPLSYSDGARALTVDALGNVYVTGASTGTRHDYLTIKYDGNGQVLWVARYSGPGNGIDRPEDIAVDHAGNVYVTGWSDALFGGIGGSDYDFATIKYDAAGEELWVARFDGTGELHDYGRALAIDRSGNVYVTGSSKDLDRKYNMATLKYGPDGDLLWVARYLGRAYSNDGGKAIAVDDSGHIYVTGSISGVSGSYYDRDYATIKYDTDGNELWVARYDGPRSLADQPLAIVVDRSGNVHVTGRSDFQQREDYSDYATIKYDPAGNELWVALYNGPANGNDYAAALALGASGNVYVTGSSVGTDGDTAYATIKYDRAGHELWVARYDRMRYDIARAMALDAAGNVYVTGRTDSDTSFHIGNYGTVKYDPAGRELWSVRFTGLAAGSDGAADIALDSSGNVYVTGSSWAGSDSSWNFATIKYSQRDRGDLNCDGAFDGADIDLFWLALGSSADYDAAFPDCDRLLADMNGDHAVDGADVELFFQQLGITDCNANGVPDQTDIASGDSADCNGNGVPDECEPDCNANGLADECDIASGSSADCNENGVPDECERDCNANGLPDPCDIANGTSRDCNLDGVPDECEFDPFDGFALDFDGIRDGVVVPRDDTLVFGDGAEITIEAWIRPLRSDGIRTIVAKNRAGDSNYFFRIRDGRLQFGYRDASDRVGYLYATEDDIIGGKTGWRHVAVSYTFGVAAIELFVDGGEVPGVWIDGPGGEPLTSPSQALTLGTEAGPLAFQSWFRGVIDEVRLWNVRRSAAEIRAHRFRHLKGDEAGLVSYWRFDEGVGDLTEDLAGDNDATLQGLPVWREARTCKPLGDLNCDGAFDGADIDPFFLALADPNAYATRFPDCDRMLGDLNGDGALDGADIEVFFQCLVGGACP